MHKILISSWMVSFLFLMVSCKKEQPVSNPQGDTVKLEGNRYLVDPLSSKVEWKGYKVLKSENTSHIGLLKFKEGEVLIKDNQLIGGKFVVDVNSLQNLNIREKDEKAAQQLEEHLKSADFFDVVKHPTAVFEITKVMQSENSDYNSVLEGNITIKGVTKPASFPANVTISEQKVSIATESKDINREDFGVNFKSPIENGVIKNDITLQILVKADKEVK